MLRIVALFPSFFSFSFRLIANGRIIRVSGIATCALTYAGCVGSVRGDDPRRCGGDSLLWEEYGNRG